MEGSSSARFFWYKVIQLHLDKLSTTSLLIIQERDP